MPKNNTAITVPKHIFITGTDTEVGKTYVTERLLTYFNHQGLKTVGLKPIASDAQLSNGKLLNSDALALQQAASVNLSYDAINPYCFEPAIAPHLAAAQANVHLSIDQIQQKVSEALNKIEYDLCLIEGAGGWHVPLNKHELYSDFVIRYDYPVILVVGIKLGCINHALLTAQAIKQSGCELIGWIANCSNHETLYINENITTIKQNIASPLLATILYQGEINVPTSFQYC